MSKLIGTNPNQVPSNADLGTAAFMDKKEFLLSKGSEMSAINAVIPKTAVDVFVYDTAKDSDGGAWRKRVQHTSWYNERLNTTTRGSRKEFPAVAVIVADSSRRLTIYDADDPDMPMWMVFIGAAGNMIYTSTGALNIAMLNGKLVVGCNGANQRLRTLDFIKDSHTEISHTDGQGYFSGGLSSRNVGTISNFNYDSSLPGIVDRTVNDVAMTVLPNAPIDPDTGLPIPTIAVATDGGVSVIKDTGVVWDIVSSTAAGGGYDPHHVSFDQDNRLTLVQAYDLNNIYLDIFDSLPTGDIGQALSYSSATSYTYLDTGLNVTGTTTASGATFADLAHAKDDIAMGTNRQLTLLNSTPGAPTKSMVAYVTSDYNTGWMVGDTKLATLSDTDTTSLSGTNRCAADNFSSGWTVSTGSNLSISNNQLAVVDTSNTGASFCDQTITTIVGQEYVIDVTATGTSGTGIGLYVTGYGGPVLSYRWEPTYSFTATTTSTVIRLYRFEGHTGSGTITSVIIKEAASDRSVNGNGVSAFGTITKTAVATGAELVGYSGFSSSNYLEQPYNSDLDFGTGDFSFMTWFNLTNPAAIGCLVIRSNGGVGTWGSQPIIQVELNSVNVAAFAANAGFSSYDTVNVPISNLSNNTWHSYVLTRAEGMLNAYIDGRFIASVASTRTLTNTAAFTRFGERPNVTRPLSGSMALTRFSATAPTAEQIAKMYNDEKQLFQENAKATLYGTSDAVTALAYDDDTELLHVGTSAGRSDFQGLRRINNTTRAIGTAISAVDGFIVEE